MSGSPIDPVTVEIVQNALISFIREMRGDHHPHRVRPHHLGNP